MNHSTEEELDHRRLRRRLSSVCIDRSDWLPECNDGLNLLIVVAGASGDLAKKKTYPALYFLYKNNFLPPNTKIVGYARSEMTDGQLRERIAPFLPGKPEEAKDFLEHCLYVSGTYDQDEGFKKLECTLEMLECKSGQCRLGRLYYLALPPNVYPMVCEGLKRNCDTILEDGMNEENWIRIIVEKPFGRDTSSSEELAEQLDILYDEEDIYRIDHYLGKEMLQNLFVLRFANTMFSAMWSRDHIASVQITFKEDFGTQGRGGYFDNFGIIRDMIATHLSQILAFVAMEKPATLHPDDIRDEKLKLLRNVRPVEPEDCVLGQYVGKGDEPGYLDDPTVPAGSKTPTFASLILKINNDRWADVPFIIKAGKALNERKADIRIQLRQPPTFIFPGDAEYLRNEFVVRLQPDEAIYTKIVVKTPGLDLGTEMSELDLDYRRRYPGAVIPDAYSRLILEAIRGDQQHFLRRDELKAAWSIFTPLLEKIDAGKVPVHPYEFGSRGPEAADALLDSTGYKRPVDYVWSTVCVVNDMHMNHTFYNTSTRPCCAPRNVHYATNYLQREREAWAVAGKRRNNLERGTVRCMVGMERQMSLESLARVKSDETVLFKPVPGVSDGLRVVYAYPNEYSVGITSLGYQLVWAFLETNELVHVSRMFTDAADDVKHRNLDLVGFSFSWELDYSNLISMLETLGIPIRAADRQGGEYPIVFGGGPVLTANPEPYAEFFDVILLGDGEKILENFIQTAYNVKSDGTGSKDNSLGTRRMDALSELTTIPGIYIPQFYEPVYDASQKCKGGLGRWGPVVDIRPVHPRAQAFVEKQTYRGDTLASSTCISPRMAWENIFMAEVVRSCPEMCRFCLASYLTLPFRSAPLEGSLIPLIEQGLEYTDRIGLLGASVTQHPEFDALLDWLMKPERSHVRLSIASVRTNTVTPQLAAALSSRGTKSLTIAVESGSPHVRKIVNKKLEQEDIELAAIHAQEGGLKSLKLYGMVGIPGEMEEDVDATIEMMLSLKKAAPKLKLTLGCSTFVPKAHTPFQWRGVDKSADKRLKRLDKSLKKAGIQFRPESYKWSVVQSFLSRGDRRMTEMLLQARDLGDSLSTFKRAAKEVQDMPPLEYYAHDDYNLDQILPWQHLHGPLPIETLRKHYLEAESLMKERI